MFISYARKDAKELAEKLYADLHGRDLEGHRLEVWLDTSDIPGGARWTGKIEEELDRCDVVLALMTQGSYESLFCQAEQLRALRSRKCVIPVLAAINAKIPFYMEPINYRDFVNGEYGVSLGPLLEDIGGRKGAGLKAEYRTTYVTAPPLPGNFVERPYELASLRNAVMTEGGEWSIGVTALAGMGGIGKTVLAQSLCHDEVVQQAYPDGILWVTAGKESTYDLVTRMREVAKGLNDDLSRYDNELGCKNQYRNTIRQKAALIVVDDVWDARDLEPFRAESARSRLLFTTRSAEIAAAVGARKHTVNVLDEEQSLEVLAKGSGKPKDDLPAEAPGLIRECGRLPLALSMVGAMLRDKPESAWARVLKQLQTADLNKIKASFPDYPHTDLLRAIQVSVDDLDEVSRERYFKLAVLLEDMSVHPAIQRTLWGVDEDEAEETAERFIGLSLAQREGSGFRLHDLQLDYVRAQYADRESLELIQGAMRLSSHVIEKEPDQFASHLVGRLLPHRDRPAIRKFTEEIAAASSGTWLRPLLPALQPPGTGLLRTLEGHSDAVHGVAVTADGKRAVSASGDNTLKVWDLDSGRALRTLEGHFDSVSGVAVTADGKRAVSASWDKTLKVWDLESGRALGTLEGHSASVYGVAVTADGKRAFSASGDNTLKVWDLDSGRALRTLEGHSNYVYRVAVTADGKRAVSASLDHTLKVWDLESGRALRTLEGHSDFVYGVAVTADGKRAVSASWDNTLKVWDLDSGRLMATFHCDAHTRCCAFLGDQRIVAGDDVGRLHFLQLQEGP